MKVLGPDSVPGKCRIQQNQLESEVFVQDNNNTNNNSIHRFLYIQDSRIIGILVGELITEGYLLQIKSTSQEKINNSNNNTNQQQFLSIKELLTKITLSDMYVSTIPQVCQLGIAQIWVHAAYRHQGIAKHLLDCARKYSIYAYEIP